MGERKPPSLLRRRGWFGSEGRLNKRVIGACENVLNKSKLKLVGGEHNGKILKATQLKPTLLAINPPGFSSIQKQEQFRVELPKIFEALLLTDGFLSNDSYIDSVGGVDCENLARAAVDLAAPERDENIVIRTVFGATEEMPLRALSYIIPGLVYAENIKRLTGIEPQLQFILATNITSTLNGMDQQKTTKQAMKLARVARDYIGEFFPDIKRAIFLQDIPLEGRFKEKLEELARSVSAHASSEMINRLLEKGENHNGGDNFELYGGAHILMHDASSLDVLEPVFGDQPSALNPSTIISIGGKQEGDFYRLRHEVKPFVEDSYRKVRTIQYFTKHHIPPYYMDRNGDVSLDEALSVSGELRFPVGKSASYDTYYLHFVSGRKKDFINFLREEGVRHA